MEIKIKCDCGFEIEGLLWDNDVQFEEMVKRKLGRIITHYCESGGIYGVLIVCPKCGSEYEIATK